MTFLLFFARIVVECWRQLDGRALVHVNHGRLFLRAFELLAERAIDRLTLHGVVDAMISRGALRGYDAR